MALTNIIRRAASRVIPSAVRATRRYHHHQRGCATLFSAAAPPTRGGALPQKLFSSHNYATKSKSDETLVKVIDFEIQCAEESNDNDKIEDIPESFPFKIEDEPGQQTVILTREYQGESISVEVSMPDLTGEENENDDDDDSETGNQSQLPMVVRVSKRNGPCLEFGVTAFPDEIAIDSLSIKDPKVGEDQIAYEGPDFGDLDENLQKAFHKYLDIRGINARTTNFLHEYMINKDGREYVTWLKNVKKFVEA
ncbi:complement component [Lithospermum erythrorhizon]|uniref:Complement component n=1 Tax=Lithospermum erythrorhizon TaxID=34254 RepID=A0AAV3Q4W7_LITER